MGWLAASAGGPYNLAAMRYYFDWMVDHRFTDFLKAKRDLFLFPPTAEALGEFHLAIRTLLERIGKDAETVKEDDQRAFFMRRFEQELEPLAELSLDEELAGKIDEVQAALTDLQDRIRAYTK